MATKIKDTPILYGKDAERFEENMRKSENTKASQDEYNRVISAFRNVKIVDKRD